MRGNFFLRFSTAAWVHIEMIYGGDYSVSFHSGPIKINIDAPRDSNESIILSHQREKERPHLCRCYALTPISPLSSLIDA